MSNSSGVRLVNSAIDIYDDKLILRGVVDPSSLRLLKTDDYQREAMPIKSLQGIVEAIKEGGSLPDIELGLRGHDYRHREGTYSLMDDVYIIDGLQRVSAALYSLQTGFDPTRVRLGAVVHFDTDKEWERERFRILNTLRKPVAPTILMRNMRDESPVVAMMYELCQDPRFALKDRVAWTQHMNRGDILTGVVLARVAGYLHSHKGPGITSRVMELVPNLDRTAEVVGMNVFRSNLITFFDALDSAFGVRHVQYKNAATHLRLTFLCTLARLFALHKNFWRNSAESRLHVDTDMKNKLGSFALQDPTIRTLSSQASRFNAVLFNLMVEHLNSGKRTHRLERRMVMEQTVEACEEAEVVPLRSVV